MNKRCIVDVATGELYCKLQERLYHSFKHVVDNTITIYKSFKSDSFINVDKGIDVILWNDVLPPNSKPHSESPYGFKVHAIKYAYEQGYTSILWLDSPCIAVKEDISPIFDKMERYGYYAMSHIDPLENWVGDKVLNYWECKREDLKGLNLPSGSCYGFDLSSQGTLGFWCYNSLIVAEGNGRFKSEKILTDCWHRHDEACLAMALRHINSPIFIFDPLFQSDSEECVIRSGGWL